MIMEEEFETENNINILNDKEKNSNINSEGNKSIILK